MKSKMEKPCISIITVCYNAIETIEKTIKSVVEQTYPNIEYIVIDGASKDGTLDIINKYKDKINVIVSEPDKGIYDAMNKGIAKATGEWIHFRNSGDFFLHKDSVELFFKNPIDADVDIIHGNCLYYNKDGWFVQNPPSLRVSYRKEIPVLHPATFVRTQIQKQMPFDLQYRSSADYDFFFKCCEREMKFEYRPISIVAFALGGFSANWERAYFEDCRIQGRYKNIFSVIKVYFDFLERKGREQIKKMVLWTLPKYKKRRNKMESLKFSPLPMDTDFADESN